MSDIGREVKLRQRSRDGLACPACDRPVEAWRPAGAKRRSRGKCPHCGAVERHRFLAFVLELLAPVVASADAVLDIAPHEQIRSLVRRDCPGGYVGLDIGNHLNIDVQGDMTRLCFPDDAFDLIICYHVLEHIPNDTAAMSELARVLRPGGVALVQVPWKRDQPATDEDPSAPEEERVRRFGQSDHVRYYGRDIDDRLEAAGLHVRRIEPHDLLTPEELYRFALLPSETLWLCQVVGAPEVGVSGLLKQIQPDRPLATKEDLRAALERSRRTLETATSELKGALKAADKADIMALRAQRASRADARRYTALRQRRSVRVALALASLTKPLFRLLRGR